MSVDLKSIEGLYQEGKSDPQVCRALRINKRKFDELYKTNPAFRECIDQGRIDAEAWWEDQGQKGAIGEAKINAPVWSLVMKNRYNWAEKQENKEPQKDDLKQKSDQELLLEMEQLSKTLRKDSSLQ